jgi:formylglycine-generating enzyme required for sulfatase activity
MLPPEYHWIGVEFEPEGNPRLLHEIALQLETAGNREAAATVYDRAFGLDPGSEPIREGRRRLLEQLAVVEHGLRFCYVPGGVFLMGCDRGEPDERPWHPVWLTPYWVSDTPISWAAYCRLMDWTPPPEGFPRTPEDQAEDFERGRFHLYNANKIRLQYCEDRTTQARDWHAHLPGQQWQSEGRTQTSQEFFGTPARDNPEAPWEYNTKPMIAIGWQDALALAERLSIGRVRYSLPTEAQWEKAARGGLIGARHAWGDNAPTHDGCDFDHFAAFSVLPMKTFPPNGYGLYAVNGGVWEWTGDWYDGDYYRQSPETDPEGPPQGKEKVLRGGSWADCAEAVTVTFRMSRESSSWTEGTWGGHLAPNIGFRLCRTVMGKP